MSFDKMKDHIEYVTTAYPDSQLVIVEGEWSLQVYAEDNIYLLCHTEHKDFANSNYVVGNFSREGNSVLVNIDIGGYGGVVTALLKSTNEIPLKEFQDKYEGSW